MRPGAYSNGHDGPGLTDELDLGVAAVVEQIVVGGDDTVGEPVVAHDRGAQEFLTKPVDFPQLEREVATVVAAARGG